MFSKKIKEGLSETGMTYRELAKTLDMPTSTISYRLNNGYKKWSISEILKITQALQSKGFNVYPEHVYADILREIDVFEDLLEYVPVSKKGIADYLEISPTTLSIMLRDGITDIHYIQELKRLISTTTLFRIREKYW